MRARLEQLAAAAGLPLQWGEAVANTQHALEAAEWARDQGPDTFDRLHHALFQAYFAQGRNISSRAAVVEVAAAAGLDGAAVRTALETHAYADRVREMGEAARQSGIHSIPTFILDGRYLIAGAHDAAVFEQVLTQLGVPRRTAESAG